MSGRSPGKVAVVTGASQGLGKTVASLLAREGYDLVVAARHRPGIEREAIHLRELGVKVVPVAGDLAQPDVRAVVRARVGRRPVAVLVNNASELGPSPLPPLAELTLREFERVVRVNTVAPLALVQTLLGPLARAHGLVVNISSDAAIGGYPGWGAYGASKAALDLLSLTLAHELARRSVAVVSVDPGDMRTTMHQRAYPGQEISDRPLPEVTLPFWAWLLHQEWAKVSGSRFRAQADRWEVPA